MKDAYFSMDSSIIIAQVFSHARMTNLYDNNRAVFSLVVAGQSVEEVTEGNEGVGADSVPAETLSRQVSTGPTSHACHTVMIMNYN